MKKIILVIIVLALILMSIFGIYYVLQNKKNNSANTEGVFSENEISKNDDEENNENNNINNNMLSEKKYLVVYYSAQGHTKNIAKKIADNLKADVFEIVPKNEYTSEDLNWNNENSRVSKEHEDESLRNVELKTTKVNNWENYDTVIISYPIWWGIAAWPVNTFVKENDFTGKTVIPVCTSASSSLGNSGKLLEDLTKTGNWQEGHRFSSNATDFDIKSFIDSIK